MMKMKKGGKGVGDTWPLIIVMLAWKGLVDVSVAQRAQAVPVGMDAMGSVLLLLLLLLLLARRYSMACATSRTLQPSHQFGVWGSEFGVWGLGFVVCGLWFVGCGLWFVVCGLWFAVCSLWFAVWNLRLVPSIAATHDDDIELPQVCTSDGYRFGVWGLGFRVWGLPAAITISCI